MFIVVKILCLVLVLVVGEHLYFLPTFELNKSKFLKSNKDFNKGSNTFCYLNDNLWKEQRKELLREYVEQPRSHES